MSLQNKPTIVEKLLGIEGLALLRLAFSGDAAIRAARVREIRALVEDLDETQELLAPIPSSEFDLDAGYRLWAQTYDRPLRLSPIEEPIMHRIMDLLPPATALDAACGTGRHSDYLANRGHRVIGVDRSSDMLEKAREKIPEAQFREGDLTALPVDDTSVDAVVCSLALVHLEQIDKAMAEISRVVRPGGRVVISDVHPFPILLGWQAQFRTTSGDPGFIRIHQHPVSEYCQAAAAAGLRILNCYEPLITPETASKLAANRLPEANLIAWVGLPGVLILDMEKPASLP